MKVEIEIPDPPEGWVFDGFRQANPCERFWHGENWCECKHATTGRYPVAVKVKPLWEPSPELLAVLRPGWIARDCDGKWFWFSRKPKETNQVWASDYSHAVLIAVRRELLPPDHIYWRQTCFKIGDPQ